MRRIGIIGLLKIELPGANVRLCDGGFLDWPDDGEYRSKDPTFGTIGSVAELAEGMSESVPALDLVLLPASTAAAADLSQPGFQRSRVRFWIAEYAPDDGLLVGDPELQFDGMIDQTVLGEDRASRELAMTIVSRLERLFFRNRGNSLNPRFHKSIWPGETGHDQATGLGKSVAWGTEAPPVSVVRGSGPAFGGGFGGSRGGDFDAMPQLGSGF
jgi:hypothetical protein